MDHRLLGTSGGIDSLERIANPDDRVCVLNILGKESRVVTPVSHAFSGGNVVFGTSPGRGGQILATALGDIPVYNDIRQGLRAGHAFNTGVVYLPPGGVRDGVVELAISNPGLEKVVILTEKVSIHDAREIRAFAQRHRFEVFGPNTLGVADSWNGVRIGGALGGDDPEACLIKGSVAIFSNSGNFTATIATYLASAGWGTTTLVSSGKDLYINFAAPEFIRAFDNDHRSRAAVLYVEPGGYYEHDLDAQKPVVACVVGRWKSRVTQAVGHAGAIAGPGDDACAKEGWFLRQFGCSAPFTPQNPVCSRKGALVLDIAHIPAALDAVMALNQQRPDFTPTGDLSLKPWFGNNQGLELPPELDIPLVKASPPYAEQIASARREIGVRFARQSMRDASGATQIDAQSQTARIHGVSVIEAAGFGYASNFGQALLRERPAQGVASVIDAALVSHLGVVAQVEAAIRMTQATGNSPNLSMMVAAASLGPEWIAPARRATEILIDFLFGRLSQTEAGRLLADHPGLFQDSSDERSGRMLEALRRCENTQALFAVVEPHRGFPSPFLALALCAAHACEGPLKRRRISVETALAFPWHVALAAGMIGALEKKGTPANIEAASFQEAIAATLAGRPGDPALIDRIGTLLGLLASNGPGTISAQGAKLAVSADGPETASRVLVNKAYIGFLASSGYAHGGNGYEGVRFLLDCFKGIAVSDPAGGPDLCNVPDLAGRVARAHRAEKEQRGNDGQRQIIPGINHPVFRGKAVNIDPREEAIWSRNERTGRRNLFHDFYRALVHALHAEGATNSVFCVNIDGVIAAELLAGFWPALRSGAISRNELEDIAFAIFLVARIVGVAAEIEDHRNRGLNLDMRIAQEKCRYVI